MGRRVAMIGVVVLFVAGCATGADTGSERTGSPTSPVTSATTEQPSSTTERTPTTQPSPTTTSAPGPLTWSEPELLAADSTLPVRATAVAGPGGYVGYRETRRTAEAGPTSLLYASSDGESWDEVLDRDGLEIDGLLAGGPGYVVIGTSHLPPGDADLNLAPWAAWSPDGLAWHEVEIASPADAGTATAGSAGPRITGTSFADLVATPSGFVALGRGQGSGRLNVLWVSSDGKTWDLQPGDPFGGEAAVRELVRSGDRYIAYGNGEVSGDVPGPLMTWYSDDARSWARAAGHETFEAGSGEGPLIGGGVALGDGFALVGAGVVSPPMAWTSADGSEWGAPTRLPTLGDMSAIVGTVAAAEGRIVAAGREVVDGEGLEGGTQYPGLWTSTDGTTWAQVPPEELRGGLTEDGVSIDALAVVDGGWLALGRVWDYPDEIETTVAWRGR